MNGQIFLETLRRTWRGTLMWGIGMGSMGIYTVLIIPDSELLKKYGEIMKSMPSFVMNMVGGGNVAALTTPAGFLAFAFFGWVLLIGAVYAVIAGLSVSANEEDRGIMDALLSMPISRSSVILEKLAAYIVNILVIVFLCFLSLWIPISVSPFFSKEVATSRLIESILNMIPSLVFVLAFTALVAVIVRRRSTAMAIAATLVTVSYFIDVIGRSVEVGGILRYVSFYSYYDSNTVMMNGLNYGNVFGLLAVAAIMIGGTVYFFQRRDIGL